MRIFYVTSEVVPYSKTGGLGDVSGALPRALRDLGHDVAVFTPFYKGVEEKTCDLMRIDLSIDVPLGSRTEKAAFFMDVMPDGGVPVYFVQNDRLYGRDELYTSPEGDYLDNAARYIFMCRAAVEFMKRMRLDVEIVHANDWQAAMMPVYFNTLYRDDPDLLRVPVTVLTVHNLAFQGQFWHWDMPLTGLGWEHFNWQELEFYGKLNLLKGGLVYADVINTVSKTYAKEIQTEEYGYGLEGIFRERSDALFGIQNGIDDDLWNPVTDDLIPCKYTAESFERKTRCKTALMEKTGLEGGENTPLVGMVSRLTDQKGLDLVASAMEKIMDLGVNMVILGTGEPHYHEFLEEAAEKFPGRLSVNLEFNNQLSHEIEAGADIFLMPSRYEPGGLNQVYSLRYGTVPVVRKTGGLADTVKNCTPAAQEKGTCTGFVFREYTSRAMLGALKKALKFYEDREAWKKLATTGMKKDWSWKRSARAYVRLYKKALSLGGEA